MDIEDVAIIGAGPAGMAAGIQLGRSGLRSAIFEANRVGGLLLNANLVENYPGFPDGIRGTELAALFEEQLLRVGVKVRPQEVKNLDFADGLFIVKTTQATCYSRSAVVASGTRPILFNDFEMPAEVKPGIYYEVAPLLDVKSKNIVIVGSGDAAFDYALNLGRYNRVTVLIRGAKPKCLPLLRKRAEKTANIDYIVKAVLTGIIPRKPSGLHIDYIGGSRILSAEADFIVFALGRKPRLGFLSGMLKEQSDELVSRGLLYFAGDLKNGIFRQTSLATGDGVKAAMMIYRKLRGDAF